MTLTEIVYYFRKLAPVIILSFIFCILFYFLIKLTWPMLFPPQPKPLATDPIFGKITRMKFTHVIDYPPNPDFILDTIEGEPVTATQTAKIFYLPQAPPRFGYLQTIYLMAQNLGFDTELTKHKIENEEAVFQDEEKKLTIDIANFNFEFKYNYENNEEIFTNAVLISEDLIKERIKQFLRILGKYSEELAKGRDNLIYLNYNTQTKELGVVDKISEANAFEMDFYRPDIDSFPIVSPKYFNSQNYVIMLFRNEQYKILKAQIRFFEKKDQKVGVYPLKSGKQAWQELKEKAGVIVSAGKNSNQLIIKKMFLGYYDPDVYQEYLQPVYVFLGDNGFAAYVPAIKEEYIE
jgi:hypothetical protein